jgi:hypothetical protein
MNQLCRLDFEFWQRVRSEEEQAETLVERVACVHASVDVFFHIISGLSIGDVVVVEGDEDTGCDRCEHPTA